MFDQLEHWFNPELAANFGFWHCGRHTPSSPGDIRACDALNGP
jgi:hypothetical protein